MPFSEEDKALIKNLYLFKGYASRRLLAEFPEKNWTRGGLESCRKLEAPIEGMAVDDRSARARKTT